MTTEQEECIYHKYPFPTWNAKKVIDGDTIVSQTKGCHLYNDGEKWYLYDLDHNATMPIECCPKCGLRLDFEDPEKKQADKDKKFFEDFDPCAFTLNELERYYDLLCVKIKNDDYDSATIHYNVDEIMHTALKKTAESAYYPKEEVELAIKFGNLDFSKYYE